MPARDRRPRRVSRADPSVTHGICDDCALLLDARTVSMVALLERFEVPVFFLDASGRVRLANDQARQRFGKDDDESVDVLLGDLIECAHASLPGGCGRTQHCSGCTLRASLSETIATRQPLVRRPAHSFHRIDGRLLRQDWLVSTDLYDGGVIFAIEPP